VASHVLGITDVGRVVVGFAGNQFMFLGVVAKAMRVAFGEESNTKCSKIVCSVPRTLEACTSGWMPSHQALKEAAAVGSLELLMIFQFLGVCWCDGMFAAAVANKQDDRVLVWLMEQECPLDGMGLKALKLAIEADSVELLQRCFVEDVDFADRGKADDVAGLRLKSALEGREVEKVGPLSRFMTVPYKWLDQRCLEIAGSGDMVLLRALEVCVRR